MESIPEYASSEAILVARKELLLDKGIEIPADSPFIRHFQGQLLLLFKKRGLLTEQQYANGLKLRDGGRAAGEKRR